MKLVESGQSCCKHGVQYEAKEVAILIKRIERGVICACVVQSSPDAPAARGTAGYIEKLVNASLEALHGIPCRLTATELNGAPRAPVRAEC
jgi:hypothetical protein